jgi:hypothetical protein
VPKEYGVLKSHRKFTPPTRHGGNTSFIDKAQENPLTGIVQDLKAAQGEERFARMLEKGINKGLVQEYRFRWTTLRRGQVGYKEADFVIITNTLPMVISVQGVDFTHRSASSKNQDLINDLLILQKLKQLGIDVPKVTNVRADQLTTQESADRVGRQLRLYR